MQVSPSSRDQILQVLHCHSGVVGPVVTGCSVSANRVGRVLCAVWCGWLAHCCCQPT